jgi:hypothetical protein
MPKFLAGGPKRPPTPPTPQYCSPWDEKGTILLLFKFCILLTKICNWSGAELWGKNWDTDAHAHMTYQAPTTDLHSSILPHFFKFPISILCWHYPGSLEWIAAPLAWLTPRFAPKRVCLWLVGLSTDPPFSLISSKSVPIDNSRAQESIDIFITSWKWLRKIWRGVPKM